MPFTYIGEVGHTNTAGTAVASTTCNFSGATIGGLLVICINGANNVISRTVSTPTSDGTTGTINITSNSQTTTATTMAGVIAYCLATATSGVITVAAASGTIAFSVKIACFDGAAKTGAGGTPNAGTNHGVKTSAANGTTALTETAQTSDEAEQLAIGMHAMQDNGVSYTPGSGWTEVGAEEASPDLGMQYRIVPVGGTSITNNATLGTGGTGSGRGYTACMSFFYAERLPEPPIISPNPAVQRAYNWMKGKSGIFIPREKLIWLPDPDCPVVI